MNPDTIHNLGVQYSLLMGGNCELQNKDKSGGPITCARPSPLLTRAYLKMDPIVSRLALAHSGGILKQASQRSSLHAAPYGRHVRLGSCSKATRPAEVDDLLE